MGEPATSPNGLSAEEFERFLLSRSLGQGSRDAYRHAFRRFARWYGSGAEPSNIDIARFRDDLLTGGSAPSTVDYTLTILSRYWDWRIGAQLSSKNPASGIRAEGAPVRTRSPLDVVALRRLIWAGRNLTERAVVGLLGVNGLRVNEVVGADIQHLRELDGRTYLWLPGRDRDRKSGYELTPLVPAIEAAVREQAQGRNRGALFLDKEGARLNRGQVYRITAALAKQVNLGYKLTPNDLSYTLRSIAIREGFSGSSQMRV